MTTGILLAVQSASTIMQNQAQSSRARQANRSARQEYDVRSQQTAEQYRQVNAQATDKVSARAREAMIERAQLAAIAGESGLAGVSGDRIARQTDFNMGTDIASIEANRRNTLTQVHMDARGGRAQAQSRINSIKTPSLIGTGLQLGGYALGAAAEAERTKAITQSRFPTT